MTTDPYSRFIPRMMLFPKPASHGLAPMAFPEFLYSNHRTLSSEWNTAYLRRDRHHRGRGIAVVGLGHAIVVSDHEGGAEVVVCLAGGFEGGVDLQALREGEGLEAVGGSVAEASIPIHCATSQIQADYGETIHIVRLHPGFAR